MDEVQQALIEWGRDMDLFSLPRWQQLPEIDLYMDQVLVWIEKYAGFSTTGDEKLLTPAMINNYVKLKLIPPPIKKKYNRVHMAYLITISILKQVLTIPEISAGIANTAEICGQKEAYNMFCDEIEQAFVLLLSQIKGESYEGAPMETYRITAVMSAKAFAAKVITQKTIVLQNQYKNEVNENE